MTDKFKMGSRVRVIAYPCDIESERVMHKEGLVTDPRNGAGYVVVKLDDRELDHVIYFRPDELEPIE